MEWIISSLSHDREVRKGIPRKLEILMAAAGFIVLSPLLLLVAAAVALSSRGPILFRQKRVGREGRLFVLYKFRTMQRKDAGPGITAADDPRITKVGALLRSLKLDELPELVNVLRGDMSFVGPRPEVPEYVRLSDRVWQRVLEVRPGLTDPVTVRLRNEEELLAEVGGDTETFYLQVLQPYKLAGYLEYLAVRSAWDDFRVLGQTFLAIVFPERVRRPELGEIQASAEKLSVTTSATRRRSGNA